MVLYCEHCIYATDQQSKLWNCWRCELNESMDKNNELLERIAVLLEKWLQ